MNVDHLPVDPKLPSEIAKNADSIAHRHDHKVIDVDPEVLSRYAGVYQASATQTLILAVDGQQLTARDGSSPQAAVPESDTKFFVAGAEVTFPTVAAGGYADQVTLTLASREIVYKRLDDEAAKPVLAAVAALEKRMHDNTPLPSSEDALRQLIAGLQAAKPVDSLLGPNHSRSWRHSNGRWYRWVR
jgi:hypothetical protein